METYLKLFLQKGGYKRIHTSHYIEFPVDVKYIKQRLHTYVKKGLSHQHLIPLGRREEEKGGIGRRGCVKLQVLLSFSPV